MHSLLDAAVLASLWSWAALLGELAGRLGWRESRQVRRLAGLGLWALVAWAACLCGFAPLAGEKPLEWLPVHPQLGAAMWGGGVLQLGRLAWRRCTLRVPARNVRARLRVIRAWRPGRAGGHSPLLIAAVAAMWLSTLAPPLRPDEGVYHLALPLQYLRGGGFVIVPGHGNGGFLALGDMLFLWCLAAGRPAAARGVQLMVAAMAYAAMASLLRPRWRPRLAAALCLGVPVLVWDACAAYVDCIEAAFSVVGMVCLARWCADLSATATPGPLLSSSMAVEVASLLPPGSTRMVGPSRVAAHTASPAAAGRTSPVGHRPAAPLTAAAWLLGCGGACRLLALPQLLLLTLVVLRTLRADEARGGSPARLRPLWQAAAWAGVPPMAFIAHNVWAFANPVYPFAAAWFSGGPTLLPSQQDVLARFMAQHGPQHAGLPRMGLDALWHLPWALLRQAAFASPAFDGVVGPMPLMAGGLGLICLAGRARVRPRLFALSGAATTSPEAAAAYAPLPRLILGFCGVRVLMWLSTSWQARFLVAPLVGLALWTALTWPPWLAPWLTGGADADADDDRPEPSVGRRQPARAVCQLAAAVGIAAMAWSLTSLRGHWLVWDARMLGGASARHAARLALWPASGLCERVPSLAHGASARVMLVWTQRLAAFCPTRLWSDSYDEAASLDLWLQRAGPDGLAQQLAARHIDFLLIDEAAMARVPTGQSDDDVARQWAAQAERWRRAKRTQLQEVEARGSIVLYRVGLRL